MNKFIGVAAAVIMLGFIGYKGFQDASVTEPTSSTEVSQDTVPHIPEDSFADLPYKVTQAFDIDYLRGRFKPAEHPDFTTVPAELTDRDGTYYLRADATEAFAQMAAAAAADGITLRIISATRPFNRQKSIWEAKWDGRRLLEGKEKAPDVYPDPADRARAILRWSSMPGTSRHHWGTDIDINRLTNDYFASGQGLAEYVWLQAHAASYGFCQPYSPKGSARPEGYNEEKWHWSYLPVAHELTALAAEQLQDQNIDGFTGAEAARTIGVVKNYVLGINPACQP